MTATAPMTVEEFVQWDAPEGHSYELVDGEPVRMSSPAPLHNIVTARLLYLLWRYFERDPSGGAIAETDCRVSAKNVRRPDLSIFVAEEWRRLDLKRAPTPAPTIAVEVLSPTDLATEVVRKVREYLSAGSQEVWVLDPENGEVQVRTQSGIRLLEGSAALDTPLLPGFSAPATELLAGRQ